MAVRKFLLVIGQSNASPVADAPSWEAQHPEVAIRSPAVTASSVITNAVQYTQGAYNDVFTMPATFPGYQQMNLKGLAIRSIRFLTFFNPCSTVFDPLFNPALAATTYPGTLRVLAGSSSTSINANQVWQYSPSGLTVTRESTGVSYTITGLTGTSLLTFGAAFDPPLVTGEQFTFEQAAGANGTTTRLLSCARYGGFANLTDYTGSLSGMQVRFTTGANAGQARPISSITFNGGTLKAEINFSSAFGSATASGDKFVIEPIPFGSTAIPFKKWAFFLPFCPFEGRAIQTALLSTTVTFDTVTGIGGALVCLVGAGVAPPKRREVVFSTSGTLPSRLTAGVTYYVVQSTGNAFTVSLTLDGPEIGIGGTAGSGTHKVDPAMQLGGTKFNPFPPGFNYPNHHDNPPFYQPYNANSVMYTLTGQERVSVGIGVALHLAERLSEDVYVVQCAFPGTGLAHSEVYLAGAPVDGIGWHDPKQQLSWDPGEPNGCAARLLDVLDAAVTAAAMQGDTLQCIGVVDMQGEQDTYTSRMAARYERNNTAFKAWVRNALRTRSLWPGAASTIPWVQPLITSTPWVYASTVRAAITACADVDPYMRTFEVDGIPKMPDGAHYDGLGMAMIGEQIDAALASISESASSEVDICNLALANIGDAAKITSIDPPDGSAQAALCARFYPFARNSLLEMHPWDFATKRRALTQAASNPSSSWQYAYDLPADLARALVVMPSDATDDYTYPGVTQTNNIDTPLPAASQRVGQPFVIETIPATGKKILLTNQESAVLRYAALVTDTSRFSSLFTLALSWQLASMLAGPIIKGEPGASEAKRCQQMAAAYLARATVNDSVQRDVRPDTQAPWISGR